MTNIRLPLFQSFQSLHPSKSYDDVLNQSFDQLEDQNIMIPLSVTLLEALNSMDSKDSVTHVNLLLNEILNSPSYYFPDIPLIYEKCPDNVQQLSNDVQGFLQQLVPDDSSQDLYFNWKSLILQVHLSILSNDDLREYTSKLQKYSYANKQAEKEEDQRIPGTQNVRGRGRQMAGKSVVIRDVNASQFDIDAMRGNESTLSRFKTGSITLNRASKCITSFSNNNPIGSQRANDRIQYNIAPQLDRGGERTSGINRFERLSGLHINNGNSAYPPMNLDINPLMNVSFKCNFSDSPMFKALILAVIYRGLLDKPLGNLIISDCAQQFEEALIKLPPNSSLQQKYVEVSTVFENYFQEFLTKALLRPELENSIKDDLIKENERNALLKIASISPFTDLVFVPHTRAFIESILAPLCYHEDEEIAAKAEKLYTQLINGHDWEIKKTEIVTADQQFYFDSNIDRVVLISAPTASTPVNSPDQASGKLSLSSVIASDSKDDFNLNAFIIIKNTKFQPSCSGYYDYCYGKLTSVGEIEIDSKMNSGRYIVLPSGARKEIIHELPAFDEKGPIPFTELTEQLEGLSFAGVTAVHVPGAIERNICHDLNSVTDHEVLSSECGDVEEFKNFCEKANQFGIRVLIDFTPLVSIRNSSRKYSPYVTYTVDRKGLLHNSAFPNLEKGGVPDSDKLLLNYRSSKLWDLFADELISLCEKCDISGFFFGPLTYWDTVMKRDLNELRREDADGSLHYGIQNVIEGAIISNKRHHHKKVKEGEKEIESESSDNLILIKSNINKIGCGMTNRDFSYSPFLAKLMRRLWRKCPNCFAWMLCEPEQEPFVMKSGIIPMNYEFRTVFQKTIEHSIYCENVDYVNANEDLIHFYEERNKRNPEGTFCIAPFGALMDGPYNIPIEGLTLAIDLLFYLTDVPLINGCTRSAIFFEFAYKTLKSKYEKKIYKFDPSNAPSLPRDSIIINDEYEYSDDEQENIDNPPQNLPNNQQASSRASPTKTSRPGSLSATKKTLVVETPIIYGYKWYPPTDRFIPMLKNRAGTRTKADWALGGEIHILPVSYDSHPMRAILAVALVCKKMHKCALICTSFYMYTLIYEVGVLGIPDFENVQKDAIVEVLPLIGAEGVPTYYSVEEVTQNSSSLFLDLDRFNTALYEIDIITQPSPNVKRVLDEHIYVRLERAIDYSSNTILANNKFFNSFLNIINESEKQTPTESQVRELFCMIQLNDSRRCVFREALVFATRNHKVNKLLVPIQDDNEAMKREKMAINILKMATKSKLKYVSDAGKDILKDNELGPILFVAPELGPFSKVGGLSTMVWDLAKELVNLGLDIHCVSPYYNVSPKGETGYLAKYGIKYIQTVDIYAPDKITVGIHYGEVEGVKCWFLHHYSYFAAPYQTGSSSFKLQLLVVMAKASLEMCCQLFPRMPDLIISNDWMTGLVPAIAKKQFGNAFKQTLFMHIFHNLGVGYAGKIWPGDTGSLSYIHQLPDEYIVDHFDNSIDPSMCALMACDQWATVSKKYRQELLESSPYSWLLKRFPHPFAYSNGIRFEERQASLEKLGMSHDQAKRYVQNKYFHYVDDSKCLFVFVGRIVEQKGVHLIIDCFEELHRRFNGAFQFIVGGQAAPDDRSYGLPCTQRMWYLRQRFPGNFWADPSQFFSDGLVAFHAADYTLIPSIFEPSGIVQQEAFVSGCPVIAFRTGGLADTVFEYDREKKTGNGMLFWSYQHHDYMLAIERAWNIFQDKQNYWKLRENAYNSVLTSSVVAVQWAREFARLFLKIFVNKKEEKEEEEKEKARLAQEEEKKKEAKAEKK